MSELIDRKVEIHAGIPGGAGEIFKQPLNIQFDAEMSNSSRANKATIKLYNLNDYQIGLLEAKGAVAAIFAGYGDNVGLVFEGHVIRRGVKTTWQGKDRITSISASHRAPSYRARKSASYAAGTDAKVVLKDLAESMDVGVGNIDDLPPKQYATGHVVTGNAADAASKIARDLRVEWSIQNGSLQFLASESLGKGKGVLLTPQSGLIGSPVRVRRGLEVVSELNLNLRIGEVLKVKARGIDDFYKIRKVRHVGGTRGGAFASYVTAKSIKSK